MTAYQITNLTLLRATAEREGPGTDTLPDAIAVQLITDEYEYGIRWEIDAVE